jgi:hypothetical protein
MPYILIHDNVQVLNFFNTNDGQVGTIYTAFTGTRKGCWDEIDAKNLIIDSGAGYPERPPEIVVPTEVNRRELFLSFYAFNTGFTRPVLRAAISGEENFIEFDESLYFKRQDPLINTLRLSFGITNKQMNEIFINASGI